MRFLLRSLTGLFLMAASLGVLSCAVYWVALALTTQTTEQQTGPQATERVFTVDLITAVATTVEPELIAYGEIRSKRTLEVRARSSGRVESISENVIEGGRVEAGEVLVVIDKSDAETALERVRADLAAVVVADRSAQRTLALARDEQSSAEAQADLQQRAYERQRDLAARGVGSTATVESSELASAQARQLVLGARRAVALAETAVEEADTARQRAEIAQAEALRRLEETTIRARFSGTLGAVTVLAGGIVTENEKLAELVDPDALEVVFRIPVRDYRGLLDSDGHLSAVPVSVQLSGDDQSIMAQGRISRDNAIVGEGQTGRMLFAPLDQAEGLKPGDFGTVRITAPALEGVVRLPARAMGNDGTVLVLGDEDRLEAVPVSIVRREANTVLVKGEQLNGRRVLRERTPFLGPGIKVRESDSDAQDQGEG